MAMASQKDNNCLNSDKENDHPCYSSNIRDNCFIDISNEVGLCNEFNKSLNIFDSTPHDVNIEQKENIGIIEAKAEFHGGCDTELSFKRGDLLDVIYDDDPHWWWCRLDDKEGYAPTNHLRLDSEADFEDLPSWQDEAYFGRYSELQFHLEMLLDRPRTEAYKYAIQNNASSLSGSIVLDVGCGSGILSMLCARDGNAKHVYAVDASTTINLACNVIKQNGLNDKITLLHSKVEDVLLPHHSRVDMIISEWMGTLLISECMIESVIVARDKFLKPNGKIWPSSASLYLAPCIAQSSYEEISLDLWNEMYDFDFSAFKVEATYQLLDKPLHKHKAIPDDILAEPVVILEFALKTVSLADLEKTESTFKFVINKKGTLHGFCTWFSVAFEHFDFEHISEDVILNTGPWHDITHWKHPLLLLNKPVEVDIGMVVDGVVVIKRNPLYRRHVRVKLSGQVLLEQNGDFEVKHTFCKEYKCWQ